MMFTVAVLAFERRVALPGFVRWRQAVCAPLLLLDVLLSFFYCQFQEFFASVQFVARGLTVATEGKPDFLCS